jgi:hypothetical protein
MWRGGVFLCILHNITTSQPTIHFYPNLPRTTDAINVRSSSAPVISRTRACMLRASLVGWVER